MVAFTTGAVALSNAECAFLLGTSFFFFLTFCMRTIFKSIAKDPKISNASLKTMDMKKLMFLNRQKES